MAGRRSTYTPQIEVDGASTQQGAAQATPTHITHHPQTVGFDNDFFTR